MSTKATSKSASKKEPSKKTASPSKTEATRPKKEITPEPESETTPSETEDLEDQEDENAIANAPGGNAAAIAAASSPSEMSASFKNFRHHPDMENFYRFIYENDLRHEALAIIDEMMTEKHQRKVSKTPTKG